MATASKGLFGSSLARKYWMAATGLFLCTFLLGHLLGNLQLVLKSGVEGQQAFNEYAYFMTHNPAIKLLSYVTYASILLHAIDGVVLTRQNRAARPEQYAYNKPGENSSWSSRSMALLGVITLVFIVTHMKQFWAEMHWGELAQLPHTTKMVNGEALLINDLYTLTVSAFHNLTYVLLYVVAMLALAFHLVHGVQSAFQSVGVNHDKYTPIIKNVGVVYAVLVPLAFAVIPVFLYLTK